MPPQRRSDKFKPEVRKVLLDALRAGMPTRHACGVAGISPDTFYRWMEKGRTSGEETTWHQFYLEAEKAVSEVVSGSLAVITQAAADGDWKAAAWKLERRFPAEFGRGDMGAAAPGPIVVELKWHEGAKAVSQSEVSVIGQLPEGA